LLFSQRAGTWRLWNHAAILARLHSLWTFSGTPGTIQRVLTFLYHVALDLSFRRSGGLLVVIAARDRLGDLLTSAGDHLKARRRGPAERALDDVLASRLVQNTDRRIVAELASLDGALVVDRMGHLLAYGAMTKSSGSATQGARTRAAVAASREGIAIKVSSDGDISFYSAGVCKLEV
jgi:DNA integrity scanning protein DisA with diadenylate cyclase activity